MWRRQEGPEMAETVLSIGQWVRNDRVYPGVHQLWRSEHTVALEPISHHELTWWHSPIGVPVTWVITAAFQQLELLFRPSGRELVLLRDRRDRSQIKHQDRVQDVLLLGVKKAVIHQLHQSIAGDNCGWIEQDGALQPKGIRPEDIGEDKGGSEESVRSEQKSKGQQQKRDASKRE